MTIYERLEQRSKEHYHEWVNSVQTRIINKELYDSEHKISETWPIKTMVYGKKRFLWCEECRVEMVCLPHDHVWWCPSCGIFGMLQNKIACVVKNPYREAGDKYSLEDLGSE